MTLAQIKQTLHEKRQEAAKIATKPAHEWTVEEKTGFQDRLSEIEVLAVKAEDLEKTEDAVRSNAAALAAMDGATVKAVIPPTDDPGDGGRKYAKSLADQFFEAVQYKDRVQSAGNLPVSADLPGVDVKTTLVNADTPAYATGTSGYLTSRDMLAGVRLIGTQPLTIAELFSQGTTTKENIRFVEEASFGNAATPVAEGATKPEATFAARERQAPVVKIAVRGRVSDEMLNDFDFVRGWINGRLVDMVRMKLEDQLLNGPSSAGNITGILNTSNVGTQAKADDPAFDAVLKAITKVWTESYLQADTIVMNPTDWANIVLTRSSADGPYILGNPGNTASDRIWGYRVVQTTAISAGTALVGAFKAGAGLYYREGMRLEATNSNVDDFEKNLVSIRAELRAALAVFYPKAFCKVTGF